MKNVLCFLVRAALLLPAVWTVTHWIVDAVPCFRQIASVLCIKALLYILGHGALMRTDVCLRAANGGQ